MCATVFCNPFDAGCGINWEAWAAIGTILSAAFAGVAAWLAVKIARKGSEDADARDAAKRENYAAMLAIAVGRLAAAAEIMLSNEERIRAQKERPGAFIYQGRILLKEISFVRLFRPYTELGNAVRLSAVAEVEHAATDFENRLEEIIRKDIENESARAAHYARPYPERAGNPDWLVRIHPGDAWELVNDLPAVCNRAVKALLAGS